MKRRRWGGGGGHIGLLLSLGEATGDVSVKNVQMKERKTSKGFLLFLKPRTRREIGALREAHHQRFGRARVEDAPIYFFLRPNG